MAVVPPPSQGLRRNKKHLNLQALVAPEVFALKTSPSQESVASTAVSGGGAGGGSLSDWGSTCESDDEVVQAFKPTQGGNFLQRSSINNINNINSSNKIKHNNKQSSNNMSDNASSKDLGKALRSPDLLV
mmetsp:Transcript_41218/g.88997  ORF Transcript_41218/g.88997 Transcript_41218/m.88997 type:complete len:130 (-) Transcript_41218:123-512(-)